MSTPFALGIAGLIVACLLAVVVAAPAAPRADLAPLVSAEASGDPARIDEAAAALLVAARGLGDRDAETRAHLAQARNASRLQQAERALADAERALALAIAAGDRQLEGEARIEKSGALQSLGDYRGAAGELETADGLIDVEREPKSALRMLLGLSALASRTGDRAAAFQYVDRGLAIAEDAGLDAAMIQFTLNRTQLTVGTPEHVASEPALTAALVRARELARPDLVVALLSALSGIHDEKRDFVAAEARAREALVVSRAINSPALEGYGYVNLADALAGLGRRAEARQALDAAIARFTTAGNVESVVAALKTRARFEEEAGQLRPALATLKQYIARNDALIAAARSAELERLRIAIANSEAERRALAIGEESARQQLDLANQRGQRWLLLAAALAAMLIAALAIIALVVARRATSNAHAASRAAASMLAFASHEVRNPVHGIAGLAELLQRSNLDPRQRELVRTVQRAAENLGRLAEDFLEYARARLDRLPIRPGPVEIRELIQSVVLLEAPRAEEEGLVLHAHIDPNVPDWVLLDGPRLRQVLLNLVGNAIRYSHEGRVDIRVLPSREGPGRLRFDVRDSGQGISAEDRERLFQPFTQGDKGLDSGNGAGLGLSICKDLVQAMGGTIGVEPATLRGTTFYFEMPAPVTQPPPPSALANLDGGPARGKVLVVDDDPISLNLAVAQLRHLGLAASGTTSPIEALVALKDDAYDAVLLDYLMPEMDCLKLAERIRTGATAGRVPKLIAISGREASQITGSGVIDNWLLKPVSLAQLAAAFGSAMGMRIAVPEPGNDGTLDAPDTTLPVIDTALFDELKQLDINGESAQVVLTQQFRRQLPALLSGLAAASSARDEAQIGRIAHRLRGSAGALGLAQLADAARRIEQALIANPKLVPTSHAMALAAHAQRAIEALEQKLDM